MAIFCCKNCGVREESHPLAKKKDLSYKEYKKYAIIATGYDRIKYLCDCPYCGYHYGVYFATYFFREENVNQYLDWYLNNYLPDIIKDIENRSSNSDCAK